MYAWMIHVPRKFDLNFYKFLIMNDMYDRVVYASNFYERGNMTIAYIGKFDIDIAEKMENETKVTCMIMGPSWVWRKAIECDGRLDEITTTIMEGKPYYI